ncbi:MAG: hypothetical protein R3185_04545, partial [Candidatus Thermoplasmatota archaeon]|nr:hypothetical protein [Candidatus Thermoplasmatota archaeon]
MSTPKVAVLLMEGTNCEDDIARAFRLAGGRGPRGDHKTQTQGGGPPPPHPPAQPRGPRATAG